MEEGSEDGAVGAVFGTGGAEGDISFEDGEADGGRWGHGLAWWVFCRGRLGGLECGDR